MSRTAHTFAPKKQGPADGELDPTELSLLEFLDRDIEGDPECLVPLDATLMVLIEEFTAGVAADLDARLPVEDE